MPVSKKLCLLPHNGVQVLQHMMLSSLLWICWLFDHPITHQVEQSNIA